MRSDLYFQPKGKHVAEDPSNFRLFRERFTDEDEISLNILRVQKYMNNTRMEELARDNMPFMGLEIHGLEELTLKQVRIFNLHKIFYFIKCPKFYFIFFRIYLIQQI